MRLRPPSLSLPPVSIPALIAVAGPDIGTKWSLQGERLVIGSHEPAEVFLHDPSVAPRHAELRRAGARLTIEDLGGGEGTYVDAVLVQSATLRPGQVITVGATQLQLRDDAATAASRGEARRTSRFGVMVGRSTLMRGAWSSLERAAASDVTVLLEGETGTGKESAAEFVHRQSTRASGPFVVVDCGSIPPNLLESELFGHEKGAFTGAVTSRQGAFELAAGGTVFLDEIGELAGELQPKLLRVLERWHVKRVGAGHYQPVDVRLVAATSRTLLKEVEEGRFRKDLYYRLAVVKVRMPPLRERLEDLPVLVSHMTSELGIGDRPEAVLLRSPESLARLARHAWPGNVRELRNYVERYLALGTTTVSVEEHDTGAASHDGGVVQEDDADMSVALPVAREQVLRRFETGYLKAALARHAGNVSAAARSAGVDRITFYRMMERNGLR